MENESLLYEKFLIYANGKKCSFSEKQIKLIMDFFEKENVDVVIPTFSTVESLIKEIEKNLKIHRDLFLSLAIKERLDVYLSFDEKFDKLGYFLDHEIEWASTVINAWTPSLNNVGLMVDDVYTKGQFKEYLKALQNLAFATHKKIEMFSKETSLEILKNCEYSCLKYFNIEYDEYLECYTPKIKGNDNDKKSTKI